MNSIVATYLRSVDALKSTLAGSPSPNDLSQYFNAVIGITFRECNDRGIVLTLDVASSANHLVEPGIECKPHSLNNLLLRIAVAIVAINLLQRDRCSKFVVSN